MDPVVFLIGSVLLLLFAVVLTALYYQRMRRVTKEYSAAKNVVSDVVVSFNKQLQRQEEQVDKVSYKVEALSKRSEDTATKVEEMENRMTDVAKFTEASETEKKLNADVETLKKRIDDITKAQEEITRHVSEIPEAKIEAAIPIKRERALAPLTETELRVLELIAEGGEKTAPEIKDLIKLTREHTARLVKKLYEEGYLERNTTKTPYAYRVKEEMLKILKKTETEAKT
jgi:DNA-binding CsgD family transcriptional regulator